jgi:hypothetical protein
METLQKVYGGTPHLAEYTSSAPPTPLVGLQNLGGADAALMNRLRDGLQSHPDTPLAFAVVPDGEAGIPRAVPTTNVSGGGTSSGGRSDGGQAVTPLSPQSSVEARDQTYGILRSAWVDKHLHQTYGCYVVVENLSSSASYDRLAVETSIASRLDRMKVALKGRGNRLILAIITEQPPGASPKHGHYANWDEAASSIRSRTGVSEQKYVLILHESGQAEWLRSLTRLHHSIMDASSKYHVTEAQRIKKKLKADKTLHYPVPRMLASRIRFKVAWHFEAARDLKLAAHNYEKGYDEVKKLPLTLETLTVADVFFFRLMQLQASTLGGNKAAALIDAHLVWCAEYDPRTVIVKSSDGIVESPAANRLLARLMHLLQMAESYRRYSSLMLRVLPFDPTDPRVTGAGYVRHFNGALLEAGQMKGVHAGIVQFLYSTALAHRKLRHVLRQCAASPALMRTSSSDVAVRPPAFIGREASSFIGAEQINAFLKALTLSFPWREASMAVYDAISVAAPIARQVGMTNMMAHFSQCMSEHFGLIGDERSQLIHATAAHRYAAKCPQLADRNLDVQQLANGGGDDESSSAEIVRYVTNGVSFTRVMYQAQAPTAGSTEATDKPVALNVMFTTSLPLELRFSRVEIRVAKAVEQASQSLSSDALGKTVNTVASQIPATSLTLRSLPEHTVILENVTLSADRPYTAFGVAPTQPITLAGIYVIEKVVFTCAQGAKMEVPVNSSQALSRLHAATSRDHQHSSAIGISRLWFPAASGLVVTRVWQPQPRVTATFTQPAHAIEGERHMLEITLTARADSIAPVTGMLSVLSPSLAVVEPVVGLASASWGPWMTETHDLCLAQCPVAPIEPGASVTVPLVVLTHKAGQITLPICFSYTVDGIAVSSTMALVGTVALHVLYPVMAHLTINDTMLSKASNQIGDPTPDIATGIATRTSLPTDHRNSKFIECAEMNEPSTAHSDSSVLAHSCSGIPLDATSVLQPIKPTLYDVVQHHKPDGRSAPRPRLSWFRPTVVSCKLTNNLQCRLVVDDIVLEAHAESPIRVAAAPPAWGAELNVDEEYSWLAVLVPAEGEAPRSMVLPQLGTLVVAMRRGDWGVEFEHKELAQVLLGSEVRYEMGLPSVIFDSLAISISVDYPPVVTIGVPFSISLVVTNADPVRPAQLSVGIGEQSTMTQDQRQTVSQSSFSMSAAVLPPPSTFDVSGKTQSLLSIPSQATRSVTWRAIATELGHQALPALHASELVAGQRLLGASQQFAVFVTF